MPYPAAPDPTFGSTATPRRRARLAAVPALCAAAASAAAPTDPAPTGADVAGTYALRSASGGATTVLEYQSGSSSSFILADTLALAADGTLSYRTTRARATFRPGMPQTRDTAVTVGAGTWQVRGRALALVYRHDEPAYAETLPAARLPDGSLRVRRALQDPAGDSLRYVRVP